MSSLSTAEFRAEMLGSLELVTPPSGRVLTIGQLKLHLRLDEGDDDQYLEEVLEAAQRHVEEEIQGHRQLLTATYDLPVVCWWEGALRLPRPPLQATDLSIKYWDTGSVEVTLPTTEYLVRKPFRQPGTIERAPGKVWPALQADRRLPITIRFNAGYGAAAAVPWKIKRAVLLLAAHWYEQRTPVITGTISAELAFTLKDLLDSEGYGSYA